MIKDVWMDNFYTELDNIIECCIDKQFNYIAMVRPACSQVPLYFLLGH